MKRGKISLALLILIVGGAVAACHSAESAGAKKEAAQTKKKSPAGGGASGKEVSVREAANLVLAEAKKWQADAEIVEIRCELCLFGNGKGNNWLISVISRQAPAVDVGYGKNHFSGRRYAVEDGEVKLNFSDSMYKVSERPFPKEFIDSTEAMEIALAKGAPKNDKYTLYLGKADDTSKYNKVVMNLHTLVKEGSRLVKKGVVLDPSSKEVMEVFE